MIHVICSRWGTKYSIEYVNTLYSMVSRHLPTAFKMYCQTDDTHGMNPNIECLPFLDDLPESTPHAMYVSTDFINNRPRLWDRPKLNYFKPDGWGITGTRIALDLDIVIHNDMSPILNMFDDKPLVGRSWWHNMDHEKRPDWRHRNGARNNGGFYMWTGNQFEDIWNDLLINWKKIYFVYTGGSDNFITTRHLNKFDFLPPTMFYSFNRGCEWPHDVARHKIRKDKIICVFNTDPGNATNIEIHEAINAYPEVKELWQ